MSWSTAAGGQAILMGVKNGHGSLARILAMDKGPGIADITSAMSDGYSTAGTMGNGLGAMKRIATTLEIFTGPARHHRVAGVEDRRLRNMGCRLPAWRCPTRENAVCGDGWAYHQTPERTAGPAG